ncbi:hypothetical protein EW026_g2448 [Hermanssonia centrifuga]|uniref:Uncharacterized protein n=1 Tax=Hermanssonia centrifuga TaxID=98765 RepID=A0A4S4KP98_9APHY|nr:hypothetical protein EW026_g2448 [Hermanssonia centrifuga]
MSLSHCVSLCVVTLSWPSSAPLLVLIVHVKYDLRSTHKPAIYRAVIDDVIASIKHEFDEYGVGEEVLAELQHKWEAKLFILPLNIRHILPMRFILTTLSQWLTSILCTLSILPILCMLILNTIPIIPTHLHHHQVPR